MDPMRPKSTMSLPSSAQQSKSRRPTVDLTKNRPGSAMGSSQSVL